MGIGEGRPESRQSANMAAEPETYYTPERVGYWLEHWQELRELALRTPGVILPCEGPMKRGYRRSDPLHHADIQADIERAWASLPIWSIEWNAVKSVMDGYTLREMDATYRLRHGSFAAAYQRAVREMARHLGWRE